MKKELTKEELYSPGLEGIPAARSKIGFVDGQKGVLEYRGYSIEELCKYSSFEEVSYLLLYAGLPSRNQCHEFTHQLKQQRRLKFKLMDVIHCLPEDAHPMQALQATVAALGMFYPMKSVMKDFETDYEAVIRILSKVPTIIATYHAFREGREPVMPNDELSHAANFLYMLRGEIPSEEEAKLLDICLILHAEHGLNASTFVGRSTGSSLALPYAVISNAVGSLSGELHGGANERVLKMLHQIGEVEVVRPWLEERIAKKEKIMGLGHRVYKTWDPRAKILKALAQKVLEDSDHRILNIAMELEKVSTELLSHKNIYPNVDFYSGLVYKELGIPEDLYTPIFAMARTAGWLAHWREQLEGNRIYRPTQIYEGDHDQRYLCLLDRPSEFDLEKTAKKKTGPEPT